jgi:hypothetical protein
MASFRLFEQDARSALGKAVIQGDEFLPLF